MKNTKKRRGQKAGKAKAPSRAAGAKPENPFKRIFRSPEPPLTAVQIRRLEHFLCRQITLSGCQRGQLRHTAQWMKTNGISLPAARRWLAYEGFRCDCGVWLECRDIRERTERMRAIKRGNPPCPFSAWQFDEVLKKIDEGLGRSKCDGTRRITDEHSRFIPPEWLHAWLDSMDAKCDCRVKALGPAVLARLREARARRRRVAAREGLPFAHLDMGALFEMLDESPRRSPDRRPLADAWLTRHGHSLKLSHRWLDANGGFSDEDIARYGKAAWRSLLRRERRAAHRAASPILTSDLSFLMDMLHDQLAEQGCDDTLRLTTQFLDAHCRSAEEVTRWLAAAQVKCDCGVLAAEEELLRNSGRRAP